ncbi:MAG: DUF6335 family protein [Acidobacteriota bacterium]
MNRTEEPVDRNDDEERDRNQNGIADSIEPPQPDIAAGSEQLAERLRENTSTDPSLSGGDIDAEWEMAESGGEETVAGSTPTPGQNVVEELGKAMGINYADDEVLKVGEKERERDRHRWELDPASSEDYQERVKDEK